MSNIYAESFKLIDQDANLVLVLDGPAVADVLERLPAEYLVYGACQTVGDGDLSLVGATELEFKLVVLVAVERPALELGAVRRLD